MPVLGVNDTVSAGVCACLGGRSHLSQLGSMSVLGVGNTSLSQLGYVSVVGVSDTLSELGYVPVLGVGDISILAGVCVSLGG